MKIRTIVIVFALIVVAGCVQERRSDPQAARIFRHANVQDVSATEYRVAPPDKLAIRAPGIKELDQFTTAIRPDGKISLSLVGEMYVVGKTPGEIGQEITSAAARFYNDAEIRIDVVEYNSKFYEVFGTAVRDAGRKPYTGRNTVVSALAAAGFNEKAWPQQVHLSRPPRGEQPRTTAVIDMTRVYLDGDLRQNYLLDEGDIIFVPTSPLAAWDEKTRQLLGPLSAGVGMGQSVAPAR